jgi:hypothetical protein
MIAEFSGTAYEVMDWDFDTMMKFGVLKNNKNSGLLAQEIVVYGQLNLFNGQNLKDEVKNALSNKYSIEKIKNITPLNIDIGYNKPDIQFDINNSLSGLEYPITVSYKVIVIHKESTYNGANNLNAQSIDKITTTYYNKDGKNNEIWLLN